MPTYQRRFFLGMLIKQKTEHNENTNTNTSRITKGRRTSNISGNTLKNQMSSGQIPLK